MNEADRVAEAQRWLRYSHEDLAAAAMLLSQESASPRHVCWLAQQATEKLLKSILVLLQIDFPRTHDLDALCALVPDGWKVKAERPELAELTEWAVEARYPGEWPDATLRDARTALEQAQTIWSMISVDLADHRVHL